MAARAALRLEIIVLCLVCPAGAALAPPEMSVSLGNSLLCMFPSFGALCGDASLSSAVELRGVELEVRGCLQGQCCSRVLFVTASCLRACDQAQGQLCNNAVVGYQTVFCAESGARHVVFCLRGVVGSDGTSVIPLRPSCSYRARLVYQLAAGSPFVFADAVAGLLYSGWSEPVTTLAADRAGVVASEIFEILRMPSSIPFRSKATEKMVPCLLTTSRLCCGPKKVASRA